MKAPERVHPKMLAGYLEAMSRSVFQTGIAWRVVEAKWTEIKEAFRQFDPEVVARLSMEEVDALVQDRRVIRNRRKIEAIITNARRMIELEKEHGSFQNYIRSHPSFEELVRDLKKQFKFIGETGAYYFLWVVGERVPPWEDWSSHHENKI